MCNRPSVAVLMSTYNGTNYVREQIDSILNQNDVTITLIIRDDCSTDGTPSILKEYERFHNVKVDYGQQNLGPANSFMNLLYDNPGYDYYAFADQDDIWLVNKLIVAVEYLNGTSCPSLYCSNQIVYKDEKKKELRYKNIPNYSLLSTLNANKISGCTMVFNNALANILSNKESRPSSDVLNLRMHDTWVMLVANVVGNIIYDNNGYIFYRIHNNNYVGVGGDDVSFPMKVKKIYKALIKDKKKNYRSICAKELIRCFPYININDSVDLQLIAEYKNSWKFKKKLLASNRIRTEFGESKPIYCLKVVFNLF